MSGSHALPPRWPPQCSCVVIESIFDPGELFTQSWEPLVSIYFLFFFVYFLMMFALPRIVLKFIKTCDIFQLFNWFQLFFSKNCFLKVAGHGPNMSKMTIFKGGVEGFSKVSLISVILFSNQDHPSLYVQLCRTRKLCKNLGYNLNYMIICLSFTYAIFYINISR